MQTLLNLLSAVALLIWGAHVARTGVLRVFGAGLRRALSKCVSKKSWAFTGGMLATCLTQSSNATAMIANSFAAQGLVSLEGALALGLGADAGSALMARALTLDLAWVGPLLVIVGVWLFLSKKPTRAGQAGRAVLGLGLMLLALKLIVASAQPIFQAPAAREALESLTGDVGLNALIGAGLAVVAYSSLAAVLLTSSLVAAGAVSLKAALCMTVGATVGSGLLAFWNGSSAGGAGRQSAAAGLALKLLGAAAALPLCGWVAAQAQAAGLSPMQTVVNFHLAWNAVRTLLELGLCAPAARWAEALLPTPRSPQDDFSPRFLDENAFETPSLALNNAARETLRLGDWVESMLEGLGGLLTPNGTAERARELRALDDRIDSLHSAIKMHLAKISSVELETAEGERWAEIMAWAISLEHAGDILDRMIRNLETKKISRNLSFSEAGREELETLREQAAISLRLAMSVFLRGDKKSARILLDRKAAVREMEARYSRSHLGRLAQMTPQSVETSALHLDLVSDFKRLHSLLCSIAYGALERSDEQGALPPAPAQSFGEPPLEPLEGLHEEATGGAALAEALKDSFDPLAGAGEPEPAGGASAESRADEAHRSAGMPRSLMDDCIAEPPAPAAKQDGR
jgi:phosphate:Na+ symporter